MRSTIMEAMHAAARVNSFHPILDWLDGLKWDGTARLDTFLVEAFGAVNEYDPIAQGDQWDARNAYYAAVGSKLLIASVRRLRQPGCKFDSMAILEGAQRIGKSTALATLYGREWFTDNIPPDLKKRDAQLALHGKWCVEFAEIEHLVRTEVEVIKAFLSTAVDHYRPPYGREFVDVPRTNVPIGTTNSDDYLKDQSGNTRFWPIPCAKVDVEWIAENRDQLWAEAAYREREGEAIWLDATGLQQEAARFTAGRMKEEVWQPFIARWLDKTEAERVEAKARLARGEGTEGDLFLAKEPIFVVRVLEFAIGMSKDKMTKQAEMSVANALKMLGWTACKKQKLPKAKGIEGREDRVTTTTWRMPDDWTAGADARKAEATDTPEEMPKDVWE
jgi:predicted P-loop ATPase